MFENVRLCARCFLLRSLITTVDQVLGTVCYRNRHGRAGQRVACETWKILVEIAESRAVV